MEEDVARPTTSKWFSWTGIVFAALYLAIVILCIAGALSTDGDDKGRFILLQLPLALQLALLHDLNLDRLLGDLSWTGGYLLIGLPTLALFYFVGWGLEKLVRAAFRPIASQR
ncbi:hypothetical protein MXL91_13855 [Achromobacter ruhlandii]|uniref:hypothetical protein n=1 Tax=Achromobacter ruhlandii TaxID=72557 RepID=UPI002DBE72C8|nr:hypothetical protein [Achromobacter ruhlandii]MEB6662530.1 hypothetical protein [Achromobacter ruhlandii]